MSTDDTLTTSILNIYSTLALIVGHAVLGAVTLAIGAGLGWLAFLRGRLWLYNLRATIEARRAGWEPCQDGYGWRSPDGAVEISEAVYPGKWTIYRGGAYSAGEYPLHLALRWAMQPPEMVPWVKMVKP